LCATAVSKAGYPDTGLPEVAVIGRSNVGKSSFINAVANRKNLARVSAAPGKTRTINFYKVSDLFCLVDLPGYGYAKVSKTEYASWGRMIEEYLRERKELGCVVMLLDIRREPTADDLTMLEWFNHYGREVHFVATKADKISRNEAVHKTEAIKKKLGIGRDSRVMVFSSLKKTGREEIYKHIFDKIVYNGV